MMDDKGVENLSVGIVEQAVEDYFGSRFRYDTASLRPHISDKRNQYYQNEQARKRDEIEHFFKSDWFRMIARYKLPDNPMKYLDKRYREEIFMEKLKPFKTRYGTQLNPIKLAIITQFIVGGD